MFLSHMTDLFRGHYENESVNDYVLLIQDTILFSFWKIMVAKCLFDISGQLLHCATL